MNMREKALEWLRDWEGEECGAEDALTELLLSAEAHGRDAEREACASIASETKRLRATYSRTAPEDLKRSSRDIEKFAAATAGEIARRIRARGEGGGQCP